MKPIKNHIIFKFNDAVDSEGRFITKSETIAIVKGDFDASASQPRWGTVVAAGPAAIPDVSTPGTQILIENLKWTLSFTHNSETFWRTDDSQVLAVSE